MLHELLSSVVFWQPTPGTHASSVQALSSLHGFGPPDTHTPLLQVSLTVQGLPSSQLAVLKLFKQPTVGSHWWSVQGLPSSHTIGLKPTQAPSWHLSTWVH